MSQDLHGNDVLQRVPFVCSKPGSFQERPVDPSNKEKPPEALEGPQAKQKRSEHDGKLRGAQQSVMPVNVLSNPCLQPG